MMKISIITPYYNGKKYIEDAVNSVLAQSYGNYELLIVNDASPDNPERLLEDLRQKDERIKIFHHKENQGISAARNTAINNSSGDIFALLDQDDQWLPDKLDLQVAIFEDEPDVGLVFANYFRTDELGNITGQGKKCNTIVTDTIDGTLNNLFNKNRITACSVAFRRECIDNLGLFNVELKGGTDDYEMWLKIAGMYRFKYIDIPLVKRRSHGDNTSGRFKERGMLDHLVIMEEVCKRYPVLDKYKAQRICKVYNHLARYYLKNGNSAEARKYFKKIMGQSPFSVKSYFGFVKSLIN